MSASLQRPVPPPAQHRYWCAHALLPDGWARGVRFEIRDGRFAAITANVSAAAGDETLGVVVPGLPNLHSHAFQRAMAGLTEVRGASQDSFWTWRELMYRFVGRMSPDDVEAVTAQAYMEMLESGFTRVGEFHYLHHAPDGSAYEAPAEMAIRVAAAAAQTGIALTLLPVFYAQGGFDGRALSDQQARFRNDVDRYARLIDDSRRAIADLPQAVLGVAPHSLRAVSPAQLEAIVALASDGPVHIHIAEQTAEVEQCLAWSGQRPVEWLYAHSAPDARWCLVHATHLTPTETAAIAASGAVAGLCPITEANLGDGLFPAVDFLAAGGRWGVGSDSNVRIDAAEELRLFEYGQRLHHRVRNALAPAGGGSTGERLYRDATAGGAQALGIDGGIADGVPADFLMLDADAVAFAGRPVESWIDSWLFAAARPAVDGVWRAGRRCVANGQHLQRKAIEARFRRTLERLLAH